MSLELTHLERLTNQPEDGLLTEKETALVIEKIWSDEYIDIVRNIVASLCSQENPTKFGVREIFYVTHMWNIVDALNKTNTIVAQIIEESYPKTSIEESYPKTSQDNLPSYAVIAFALNTLLVNMADTWNIRNISAMKKAEKYRTRVYICWEEKTCSKSYKGIWKPEALRIALKNRKTLLEEKKNADDRSDRAKRKEQARLGLIEKWILVNAWEWKYKVAYIKWRKATRSSSSRFEFRGTIEWKRYSFQRSISEHWRDDAYNQVITKIAPAFKLTPIERWILWSKEYRNISLYK